MHISRTHFLRRKKIEIFVSVIRFMISYFQKKMANSRHSRTTNFVFDSMFVSLVRFEQKNGKPVNRFHITIDVKFKMENAPQS